MHSILKPIPFFLGIAILGCFVYFSIIRTPEYPEPDVPFEMHQVNNHLAQLQSRVNKLDDVRANAEFHEERLIKLLQAELVQCANDSEKTTLQCPSRRSFQPFLLRYIFRYTVCDGIYDSVGLTACQYRKGLFVGARVKGAIT